MGIERIKMKELELLKELSQKVPTILLEKKIEQKELKHSIFPHDEADVVTLKIALPAGIALEVFANIPQNQ